jgi:hypothetical protein
VPEPCLVDGLFGYPGEFAQIALELSLDLIAFALPCFLCHSPSSTSDVPMLDERAVSG